MSTGSMNPQRQRRPTAWEVSFPDESSEGDNDEQDKGAEQEHERREDDLPALNSKRKTYGNRDDRPAKRHNRESPLPHREVGDKQEDDRHESLYYTPRQDEFHESAPDIAFLLGESDGPLPLTPANTEEDKPIRLLHDWAVFDARPSKAKGGALALALISLHGLDDILDSVDVGCAPEAAGSASPYFENEEDAGQEDDGDYDDDDDGAEEEEGTPVSMRLRLGALLRYTIDYTKRDDPIYLETTVAWYILGAPAPEYRALFVPFFRAHRIAQILVCALIRDQRTSLDAFLAELQLTDWTVMDDINNRLPDMRDIQDAIPAILAALDTLDDHRARTLRSTPILRLILASPDSGGRNVSTSTLTSYSSGLRHHPRIPARRLPLRVFTGVSNPDTAVLRPENQQPTHVTPRVAALATGLFREQLVVLGRKLPAPRLWRGAGTAISKKERVILVRALAMALCAEGTQNIEAPVSWRLHPRRPFMYRVALCDVRGLIPKAVFEVGDVVLVPIGEDDTKRGHKPVSLPEIPDATPQDARLVDYFWFGRVVHINGEDERVHVQWFDHASNTFLDDIADPRELFLTPLCDTLPLTTLCGTVSVADLSGVTTVKDDFDGYFFRFLYDKKDASFTDLPPPVDAHAAPDPPQNCSICARCEEEDIRAHGRIVRMAGAVTGVAIRGATFHVGDFALLRAEQGPARIVQIIGLYSGDPVWAKVQLLGRVSDLVNLLPDDELRDERHLFFTDEIEDVPLDDVLVQCYVLHRDLIFDADLWAALGAEYFYYRYRFKRSFPASWDEREPLEESAGFGCETCAYALQARVAEAMSFGEEARKQKLRAFDVFAGAGAMSLGMENATGGMKTTHAVEISPSAAQTLRLNSPNTVVYNQCVNVLLRYAVKSYRGILEEDDIPNDILNKTRLPPPPRPGDIDVITAGFPCQPHSQLNMFQKANDVKTNLILNLLSWVDFLQPRYCIFENVRGFLSYNLNAIQVDKHRTGGGISMGGLKFLVHAMLAMNYQVRFCLLQAAHYGTPQTRVRFFLFGARHGYPLLVAPQPTHDFPRTHRLEVRFPNGDIAQAVHAEAGTAPFKFVTIDDAISDLPRFDWMNPNLRRLPAQKENEACQRAVHIPVFLCDQEKPYVGIRGAAKYQHAPRTTFQVWCRKDGTKDLQHVTRTLKPATVERVVNIPLTARADYRSLEKEHWQWQFSDPASAIARKGFRPGLYGRLDRNYVFQTTVTNVEPTAKQSRVLNPYCHRMVTVRELARSQGFPDSFVFQSIGDNVVTMHRQIGNAVPWPVAAAIGRELREARLKKWRSDRQRQDAMVVD
ncbi:S-adenosyl-L-methionine-dependent methyltransferase [Russula earlei]|uniref:S-adenosyl-L-methionine-dependent methyltransferase n=1 Tax=Russula earlei TaxID=71964 RepID=A0ACC0UHI4_9AGAM|nr:S-adenosyl-L-methionine-dependent methyltransferase [Russula earlei]